MKRRNLAILLAAAALLSPLSFACGAGGGTVTATGTLTNSSSAPSADTALDRAAQLAAQTQLRNAMTDQESFFASHQTYASTAAQLRTIDAHLNTRLQVTNGTATGYEMSITADDSAHTVYIIRQNDGETQRIDGSGNKW